MTEPTPDLSQRSTLDLRFYEWLLSDHPRAAAERRRRRDAYDAERTAQTARVREVLATRAEARKVLGLRTSTRRRAPSPAANEGRP